MKKKKKVNLEAIRVQSFITALNDDEKNKIIGGTGGAMSATTPIVSCSSFDQSGDC